MPDVVVVCSDADRRTADRLSNALRKEHLHAFVAAGDRNCALDERLSAALNQASSIIVLWTPSALNDHALLYQARTADIRNALVSLSLDGCEPPGEFDNQGTTDISRWAREGSRSNLATVVDIVRTRADQAPGESREDFLRSFFYFGGLHFGVTLEEAVQRFGLPSESNESMVAYVHPHNEGAGALLLVTHQGSPYVAHVLVEGQGGVDFLRDHGVADPRLGFIGMHKDEVFKALGPPGQNIGELEDGRVCVGYGTMVGVEATLPDGEKTRFGLVIYILFYITSSVVPFCSAMSVTWAPVPLEDEAQPGESS